MYIHTQYQRACPIPYRGTITPGPKVLRAPYKMGANATTRNPSPLINSNCLKVKQRFLAFIREFPRTSSGTFLMKSGKFKGSLGFAHRRFCDFAFSYSETHTRIFDSCFESKGSAQCLREPDCFPLIFEMPGNGSPELVCAHTVTSPSGRMVSYTTTTLLVGRLMMTTTARR